MNFRQIEITYLKTIFRSQNIFFPFPLLVQNYKLYIFLISKKNQEQKQKQKTQIKKTKQNKKQPKNPPKQKKPPIPSIFKRRKSIVPYEITR